MAQLGRWRTKSQAAKQSSALDKQSAYKFDTKAEMFRTGAAEYRLLTTKINSIMRKERVYPQEWQKLWHEIELRMTELQKKLTFTPSRELIDVWKRSGKLDEKDQSGAMMPPWLIRYQQNLEDDGIQSEEDLRFIPDDVFELWEQPYYKQDPEDPSKNKYDPNKGTITRYPLVVIQNVMEVNQHGKQVTLASRGSSGLLLLFILLLLRCRRWRWWCLHCALKKESYGSL